MVILPLDRALSSPDSTLLRTLGRAAAEARVALWLVGGSVRDALLGRPVFDLDLTAETPADRTAPLLAEAGGGTIGARSQFGTVKLHFGSRTIDLATARAERYRVPGALPEVRPADLRADLERRDISINAMAASLDPGTFGELYDVVGGLIDLQERRIRALHDGSFRDDATRMLRVVRYANRLRFRIDRPTARWLRRDLGYLDRISPSRVRRELERLLSEERAMSATYDVWRRGVLGAIHPAWDAGAVGDALRRAARRHAAVPAHLDGVLVHLGVLVYALSADEAAAVNKRLGLTRRQSSVVHHTLRLRLLEGELAAASPGEVAMVAAGAPAEALTACAIASANGDFHASVLRYLRRDAAFRPPMDGHMLRAMGVEDGPELGRIMSTLRAAVLDGSVRSTSGARALVLREMRDRHGARTVR